MNIKRSFLQFVKSLKKIEAKIALFCDRLDIGLSNVHMEHTEQHDHMESMLLLSVLIDIGHNSIVGCCYWTDDRQVFPIDRKMR